MMLGEMLAIIGFFIVAGLVAAVRLSWVVSDSVAAPLLGLTFAMARVERGDLDAHCPVVSNDEIGAATEGFNRMLDGLRERETIKEAFGRYVTREVGDEILGGRVSFEGEQREVTMLFADLRDFTPWVESTEPRQVVRDLNAYFAEMEAAIRAHGGLVLQFIGDEIEAVFGAPVPAPDHAARAVRAALEMRTRLRAWNSGRSRPLSHGIGVHTGLVLAPASPDPGAALYRESRRDPASVDDRWALVFAGFDLALRDGARPGGSVPELVHAYRELGHLIADLDPLGGSPREHPLLRLSELGFSERDLDRVVDWAPFKGGTRGPLRELIAALRETYCGTLGVEYLSVADKARRDWLQERMEPRRNHPDLSADERRAMLERLVTAEMFEQFLQARYPGQKRFSLEGGEALVPLLDALVEETARLEVAEVVLGMAHRGRLNVLAHVLEKPYEMIFAEFEGAPLPDDILGDGDVKYHLGYSKDRQTRAGAEVHLPLTSNPSHLESVNPVVEGIVRAKQAYREDRDRRRVAPVLLHGDAAFMGQGIVYETLALSPLPAFTTGGTIHVIVNNQIGFTTSPEEYLFTRYPSDPAQVLRAPVFHVNADDPEAAVQAARLAAGYRQTFRTDVFIDFVCYRRHGHNELDDPTLTQPVMYEQIRNHPSAVERYTKRLVEAGVGGEAQPAGERQAGPPAPGGAP